MMSENKNKATSTQARYFNLKHTVDTQDSVSDVDSHFDF